MGELSKRVQVRELCEVRCHIRERCQFGEKCRKRRSNEIDHELLTLQSSAFSPTLFVGEKVAKPDEGHLPRLSALPPQKARGEKALDG
jgi:hypothetical protein